MNQEPPAQTGSDEAFNAGRAVVLSSGRKIRVREVRFAVIKAHLLDLPTIARAIIRNNPDVDWARVGAGDLHANAELMTAIAEPAMGACADTVEALLADSAGMEVEAFRELRLSDVLKIVDAFIAEHRETIRDFFPIMRRARGALRGVETKLTEMAGKVTSSPSS